MAAPRRSASSPAPRLTIGRSRRCRRAWRGGWRRISPMMRSRLRRRAAWRARLAHRPPRRTISAPRLIYMLAAVDRERRAGDEIGVVGDEEKNAARDVLGLAEAAHRNARHDLLEHVLRHRAHHVGVDVAGHDRVDRDAEARTLLRQRLGEAVDAGFGRGVVHLAVLAGLAVDRADVDDAAELARAHAVDDGPAGVEARGEIGADDGVPILPAHAVERAVARDARVVHDDLDRPHLFFDFLDRGLDRVVVADVELLDADSGR